MKIKISKAAILDGLQKVQSIISSRTTLPVLSNILFHAEKGKLTLSATDLEVSVRTTLDADVQRAGGTTLPAKRIAGIFREMPQEDISIDVDDRDIASIRCGSAAFKINGMSEEEFPPPPTFEAGATYTIEQAVFREMLRNTSYAAAVEETRYLLNGTVLSFKSDKLTVVATDGRRMALMEHEMEFPKSAEADLILPLKTATELLRTLGSEGTLKIQATPKQIAFEFDQMVIISKLIDGTYPNFRQVIPSQNEQRIAVEREPLLVALRRMALLATEQASSVKLSFGKNKLEISTVAPDVGEATDSLPVKYENKPVIIAFNPTFLMDPLKTLTSDEVILEVTDELSPGVLRTNMPFLYVIMPMRMN